MPKAKTGESRLLRVRVTPRSRRNEMGPIEDASDGVVKVKLTAPPVDGRANDALIELVAETFGLPRSAVEIVAGEHSRLKTLRLHGVPEPSEPSARAQREPEASRVASAGVGPRELINKSANASGPPRRSSKSEGG